MSTASASSQDASAQPAEVGNEATGRATHTAGRWDKTFSEEVAFQKLANPIEEMPTCRDLFDNWAMCFALGRQARHLYRYGHVNDCADKKEMFKFCLSLKGKTPEERYDSWIRRRAELVTSKRLTASSEDIWETRGEESIPKTADLPSAEPVRKGKFGR